MDDLRSAAYGQRVGFDDDEDCVEHVWQLVELRPSAKGMDRVVECVRPRCEAVAVQAAQATLRDTRPPL
jgi:hypothetical protein